MSTALVISSFVSASKVGANASAFCLQRLGINCCVLPTTQFGRHPGWGPPGGHITPPQTMSDMWEGIKAQNIAFDAVMTGYMGHPDHVKLTKNIITFLRIQNPALRVLVDPVMGDYAQNDATGRLYVKDSVADAVRETLVPLADIITPNLWEFNFLTGGDSPDLSPDIIIPRARAHFSQDCLITSVPLGDEIGTLFVSDEFAALSRHPRLKTVPNGGGDMLAGVFFAHRLLGHTRRESLATATAATFDMLRAAYTDGVSELPLVSHQDILVSTPPLTVLEYE